MMDSMTKWPEFLDQFGSRLCEKLDESEIQTLYALIPGITESMEQIDQSILPSLFALRPNSPAASEKLIELWTALREMQQRLAGVELLVKLSYLTSR